MLADSKPWFKNWPPEVPKKIEYPDVPLHEILKKAAMEHPEKPAIAYADREITYSELDEFTDRFAKALTALGVEKGDRAAIFLSTIPQFVDNLCWIIFGGTIVDDLDLHIIGSRILG